MNVERHELSMETRGNSHVLDLTPAIRGQLAKGAIRNGLCCVFVVGSTAAITTTEYEPGLVRHDLKAALEGIAPEDGRYEHEQTWGDDNGHSHIRASLMGPSLTVPLVAGELTLGQWQQVVLIDFDTRPRTRKVVMQVVGI